MQTLKDSFDSSSNSHLLFAYLADLELEVDRLNKQGEFLRSEARQMLGCLLSICKNNPAEKNATRPLAEVSQAAQTFADVLRDLYDPPGYHPAHDRVIAVPVRPLVEQVFRWQQRLFRAPHAVLHLELGTESIAWFPARLRHILDNLISNALKYSDPTKGETRVFVGVNRLTEAIQLRVTDNGLGMPWDQRSEALELFYRSAAEREAGLGEGLSVVKLLVEQSGGTLMVESVEGQGTSFLAVLPRFDVGDHLSLSGEPPLASPSKQPR